MFLSPVKVIWGIFKIIFIHKYHYINLFVCLYVIINVSPNIE